MTNAVKLRNCPKCDSHLVGLYAKQKDDVQVCWFECTWCYYKGCEAIEPEDAAKLWNNLESKLGE